MYQTAPARTVMLPAAGSPPKPAPKVPIPLTGSRQAPQFDKNGQRMSPGGAPAPASAPASAPAPAAAPKLLPMLSPTPSASGLGAPVPPPAQQRPLTPAPAGPPAPPAAPFNPADPAGSQLKALLTIRASIDANGWLADEWTEQRGGGGAYCTAFEGVVCDGEKYVTGIKFHDDGDPLGGTLPPAQALQQLPRLKALWLSKTFLTGTLPADWGSLGGLEELRLGQNQLFGRIPREWSGMTRLRKLLLL
jgi:hypothetical protein